MGNIIEVKNLKKYFSTPRGTLHAVDNVTFNIEKGKTIGIVGRIGLRKINAWENLMRLHDPTEGQIFLRRNRDCQYAQKEFKEKSRSIFK